MTVFLIPAAPQTACQTLRDEVSFERAAQFLDSAQSRHLEAEFGGRLPLHCWAVTDGINKRYFDMMVPGDELLFTETGSGRFQWRAAVKTTLECENLGLDLWPNRGPTGIQKSRTKPWKFIYIVDNLKQVSFEKRIVLRTLGYASPNDTLGGLRRVPDWKVEELIARFQTVDGIMNSPLDPGTV